jgi:hypothetical protein
MAKTSDPGPAPRRCGDARRRDFINQLQIDVSQVDRRGSSIPMFTIPALPGAITTSHPITPAGAYTGIRSRARATVPVMDAYVRVGMTVAPSMASQEGAPIHAWNRGMGAVRLHGEPSTAGDEQADAGIKLTMMIAS